ncbi:MAG TPA: Ig-like domain-containing protein [Verrucomicrobiae bacterium]|nr:Ig-like domain-containing protein [Verrucomicrobiae bacterium]
MKTFLRLFAATFCALPLLARAVTFTSDTAIGPSDTNYDGADIVVSNATLTVDGPHNFASLILAGGATLTHSASPIGSVTVTSHVADEPQLLTSTNAAPLANSNIITASVLVQDMSGTVTYTNATDYVLTVESNLTYLARTETSSIPDNTMVLVSYDVSLGTFAAGLNLNVTGDVSAAAGTVIDAAGRGYSGTYGAGHGGSSGAPSTGGGGGQGGTGGMGATNSFGGAASSTSLQQPIALGGAGGLGIGYGGAGGGRVEISCGGTFTLDGVINADGINATNARAGGGAGGSVWLVATNFAGSGAISANGGAGEPALGGGGGGGRIAIQCATNMFTGSLTAQGGLGWQCGGAGTIYVADSVTNALLWLNNGGRVGTNTPVASLGQPLDLVIQSNALVQLSGSPALSNLLVDTGGKLVASPQQALFLNVAGNVSVLAGAAIAADAAGSSPAQGPGAGRSYTGNTVRPCSGGGYGGAGGDSSVASAYGGATYGTIISGGQFGSGGGNYVSSVGGGGGGLLRLTVGGELRVDGRVSANGGDGSGTGGGGGSGGSVNITATTLSGTGLLAANGGRGVITAGGGGGGGRIYVVASTNLFAGRATAFGGSGYNPGGAGTVLMPVAGRAQLLVDNGGQPAGRAQTPIQFLDNSDLIVRGQAVASASGSLAVTSLTVESNSWLAVQTNWSSPFAFSVQVNSNAVIQAGGGITADAAGFGPNNGPGAGKWSYLYLPYSEYVGSGGGHGGAGGNSISNAAAGGTANDNVASPLINAGSGGGGVQNSSGGVGGGRISVNVTRTLFLDGTISASGTAGISGGGGGAGGSIYLNAGTLTGSGQIHADGGNGYDSWGGGGGGGRIAIACQTNQFTGAVTAFGGDGANAGGAGTVFFQRGQFPPKVICDNHGTSGAVTLLNTFSGDLEIRAGARAWINASSVNLNSLLVRSNAALLGVPPLTQQTITVQSNVVIEPGGSLSWDGAGVGSYSGNGNSSTVGGGSHGGYGGGNPPNFSSAYGQITAPTTPGGPGGSNSNYAATSGAGGGALKLTVNGVLQVDGALTANGIDASYLTGGAGGGAGGSLWLTLNGFTGSGLISARGGAGAGFGGGGGGGRIAITWQPRQIGHSNLPAFTGTITARGGNGLFPGGAGTVYLQSADQPVAQLILDNGGPRGTNTPLSSNLGLPTRLFDLTLANGATASYYAPGVPTLNNLVVGNNGTLSDPVAQTTLMVACRSNLTVAVGGMITGSGFGYGRGLGPGAGQNISNQGSGGGYGGAGGASAAGSPGGTTYGSTAQPDAYGSGGGAGIISNPGGSEGGGAVRLTVPGTLTVDGLITAGGNAGVNDESGGGAGGSIWITAHSLAGHGVIAADGGDGELYGGGGGGGGRIAVYANHTNDFAGVLSALGGEGANAGQNGTIVFASLPPLSITSQTPVGTISNVVSYVEVGFSEQVDPATVSTAAFTLTPPPGSPLPALQAIMPGNASVRLLFTPALNAPGDYTFTVAPNFADIYGTPMSQVYTGAFTIALPTIQGTVRDTNNAPVAGVTVTASVGYLPAMTDATGTYSIGVPPGWSGTLTPSLAANLFQPDSITLSNVTDTVTNQDFVMVGSMAPVLSASLSATNLLLNWSGLDGVNYQAYWSTNLADWLPWGDPIPGTNGPFELTLPVEADGLKFFRLGASR